MTRELLRELPRVDDMLARPSLLSLLERLPRQLVVDAVRTVIDDRRAALLAGSEALEAARASIQGDAIDAAVGAALARRLDPQLRPVVNATGVVLHTNLGRAPIGREMLEGAFDVAAGYSNLEYDLEARHRGSRYSHSAELLRHLTGAEDSLVVNNCAGAAVLSLSALCSGKEVVVSRGELIEIGGSFRVPDICAAGGAKLVEVGTTNRTHLRDYVNGISEQTSALMKVHRSNYAIVGFTKEVSGAELAELAAERGVVSIEDLGSGALVDLSPWGMVSPTAAMQVGQGLDVVMFSGDKLLGGPQAGIIVGKTEYIERIRRHPLTRAMRVDKLTLAVLERTLITYVDGTWRDKLPAMAALTASPERLQTRAAALAAAIEAAVGDAATVSIQDSIGRVGGGSLPLVELAGRAVRVAPRDAAANAIEVGLRSGDLPVVARIDEGGLVFDVRTVLDDQIVPVANRLGALLKP
jgi:L-seryl-tRNA(Ser) seleniumtransferase